MHRLQEYCFEPKTCDVLGATSLFFGQDRSISTCLTSLCQVQRFNVPLVSLFKSAQVMYSIQCCRCGGFSSSFFQSCEHYSDYSSSCILAVWTSRPLARVALRTHCWYTVGTVVFLVLKKKTVVNSHSNSWPEMVVCLLLMRFIYDGCLCLFDTERGSLSYFKQIFQSP